MRLRLLTCALAACLAAPALAAPTYTVRDFSSAGLLSESAAMAVWKAELPEARMEKPYPSKRWGFVSQVEGGLANGTCVVTARVAMLPLTSPTRRLVWEPKKMSTTFDAKTGATAADCTALATEKLKEAVKSLVTGLVN
jgi:hypothetical protein